MTDNSQKFIARNRAPRVQIEYDVEMYGSEKKVQLPFVMGVMSDLAGKSKVPQPDVAERSFLEIDVDNFDDRMRAMAPRTAFNVPNTLTGEGNISVDLTFEKMNDFSPAAIAANVDSLRPLLEARTQLSNLMAYMDGKAGAEALIEKILADPSLLSALSAAGDTTTDQSGALDSLRAAALPESSDKDDTADVLDDLKANPPEDIPEVDATSDVLYDLAANAEDAVQEEDTGDATLANLRRTAPEDTEPDTTTQDTLAALSENIPQQSESTDGTAAALDSLSGVAVPDEETDNTDELLANLAEAVPEAAPESDNTADALSSLAEVELPEEIEDTTNEVLSDVVAAAPDTVDEFDATSDALDSLADVELPELAEDATDSVLAEIALTAPESVAEPDATADVLDSLSDLELPAEEENGTTDELLADLASSTPEPGTDPDTTDDVLDGLAEVELPDGAEDTTDELLSDLASSAPDPVDEMDTTADALDSLADLDLPEEEEDSTNDLLADLATATPVISAEPDTTGDALDSLATLDFPGEVEDTTDELRSDLASDAPEPANEVDTTADALASLADLDLQEEENDFTDDLLADLSSAAPETDIKTDATSDASDNFGDVDLPEASEDTTDDLSSPLQDDEANDDELDDLLGTKGEIDNDDLDNMLDQAGDADVSSLDDLLGDLGGEDDDDVSGLLDGDPEALLSNSEGGDENDLDDLLDDLGSDDDSGLEDLLGEAEDSNNSSLDDLLGDLGSDDDSDLDGLLSETGESGGDDLDDLLSDLGSDDDADLDDILGDDGESDDDDLDDLLGDLVSDDTGDLGDILDESGDTDEVSANPDQGAEISGEPEFAYGQMSADRPEPARLNRKRFRLAILGDFSGRSARGQLEIGDALASRRPILLDPDTAEDVIEGFATDLVLPIGKEGAGVVVKLGGLDDLHPDELYENVDLFAELVGLRGQLASGATAENAARQLREWGEKHGKPVAPTKIKSSGNTVPADRKLSDFQKLIGDTSAALTQISPIDELMARIVGPHIRAIPDADAMAMQGAVDEALSAAMRLVLHHPEFQSVEAQWRSIDLIARSIETDDTLDVILYDVSAEEIAADLAASDDLGQSGFARLLTEEPLDEENGRGGYSALIGLYTFEETPPHAELLGRIARLAAHVDAPFFAAITPAFLDTDKADRHPLVANAWDTLRAMPEAGHLGLVSPRFLLRRPYGAKSEPIYEFEFEEFTMTEGLKGMLWANPAVLVAILLARSFRENGATMSLGSIMSLGEMPYHYVNDRFGDQVALPCTERNLTLDKIEMAVTRGIMSVASVKGRDEIRLTSFGSLAGGEILGPWSGTPAPAPSPPKPEPAGPSPEKVDSEDGSGDDMDLDDLLADFGDDPDIGGDDDDTDAELAALLDDL